MLDPNLREQLKGYLERLVAPIELAESLDDGQTSRDLDDLLHEESYDVCDEILKQVDAKKLPSALLRSFLTITAPAKDRLRYRETFYKAAFAEMVRVKGDVAKAQKLLGRLA